MFYKLSLDMLRDPHFFFFFLDRNEPDTIVLFEPEPNKTFQIFYRTLTRSLKNLMSSDGTMAKISSTHRKKKSCDLFKKKKIIFN